MPVKHRQLYEINLPECEGDILQVSNLSFSYPDGQVALRNVNLNLCEGERLLWSAPMVLGNQPLCSISTAS